jgi:hypothetical protein
MTDERKPPPRFRRPSELSDDEIVEIPPAGVSGRYLPPRPNEPFQKLAQTPAELVREVRDTQRKMALQLDGFGQAMNRRFDIFHEELAMLRQTVTESHAPRLEKVEATLGQKAAKGGGIVAIVLLAAPMLADAVPKYRWLFEAIAGALQ